MSIILHRIKIIKKIIVALSMIMFIQHLILRLKNKKNIKLKQFILASSQAVYGEGFYKYKNKLYKGKREYHNLKNKRWYVKNHSEKFLNHKENNSTLPINFYGLSKLFQEQIVKQCSSS